MLPRYLTSKLGTEKQLMNPSGLETRMPDWLLFTEQSPMNFMSNNQGNGTLLPNISPNISPNGE